ncbi:hypothetical protein JB92DRAFT_2912958 [Gautieria morchelliformis]|nr:hypothetical protein JB92DRAFT_2912958 [Gautieria morchelliformis]
MPTHGIWSWFVLAQVKEGTERKGSINNVIQVVRKTVRMQLQPPLLQQALTLPASCEILRHTTPP